MHYFVVSFAHQTARESEKIVSLQLPRYIPWPFVGVLRTISTTIIVANRFPAKLGWS
jgi:hypothetical protein